MQAYDEAKGIEWTWQAVDGAMTKALSVDVYRYYFDPYLDGEVIQFWIEARRKTKDESKVISQWVTRPVKSNSRAPSNCYEVTVRKGSLQGAPLGEGN